MTLIPARIQTILTSAVTWLTLAIVIAQGVIDELGSELPSLVEPIGRAVAFAAGVILIIRRVTPVAAADRGLVPSPNV